MFGSFGQKRTLLSFIRSVNSVQACAEVFETMARILRSNCVKWVGKGEINYVRINIIFFFIFLTTFHQLKHEMHNKHKE